ncbi:uncharacterized protein LOC131311373 isoform X2 [Rhododendron vialii]|uniref:uncharacterized protein LOC131311373 isoform X2 n=1 Tax=Rhododendron vialii TaxID=182163 RepID=UPI00265FE7E0|nr:uncharacterized protein LOC131311373 isoform X2 [Rhododendron vialii]
MALQNLPSLLRHKGLRSSSAIRNVNICGVATSLSKSTLPLPWMPSTQHFQTLHPWTGSLQSGNTRKPPAYVEGNSQSRGLYRDLVLRPHHSPKFHKALKGEAAMRFLTQPAAASVHGSLVCLAFLQDGEASVVMSGTVVRSDGIVATSTDCLRHLKGTEYKIGVKILGRPEKYEGVLLHTDSLSKIAFVKILCCRQLQVPECGKLESEREGDEVVAAGSVRVYGNWTNATPGYSLGLFRSIDDDVEKAVSHNARTSGQLIKASFPIGKHFTGGALVSEYGGVLGVIRKIRASETQAIPIEDVLKYLEYFEKHGEHAKDVEGA